MNSNIILAGLGGQGILFATRILAGAASLKGKDVLMAETHGMSQRGGSVLSHLKIGKGHSPLIRRGTADAIYVFEERELPGNLSFLKKGGLAFVNAEKITLPESLKEVIEKYSLQIHCIDALKEANSLGNPLLVNLILIGFSTAWSVLALEKEDLRLSLAEASSGFAREANIQALEEGYKAALKYQQEVKS